MSGPPSLQSFWMAGFEGADHRNGSGHPLDMVALTDHLDRLEADYARCARQGLRSVRESIGWRLAEPSPGAYDFARLHRMAEVARRQGVQPLWTLMHYGMPDDLHVMHEDFVDRFAAFAAAVARELQPLHDDALPPIVTPVNEVSFVAWVLSETDNMAGGPPAAASWPMARWPVRRAAAMPSSAGWSKPRWPP
ncbi:beta-galactosidase [Aquabacterium sp. J223]|uniref:beta-galactosidase n=1 Tax=Aquabacterium sp. J223 TaxID=2898431 RepID=UPI0021ADEEA2|nr:beta-galactosidase [Aquabacterium sp. J223]UUX94282.1 beta-galactosidase [Aquabacterium sp. J223]